MTLPFPTPRSSDLVHGIVYARNFLQAGVFVVYALHGQDRAANTGDQWSDVPVAERRIQPGTIPGPEGRVRVIVVAAQTIAHIGGLVQVTDPGNGLDRVVLYENMRRRDGDAACAIRVQRGIQQGDRADEIGRAHV